MKQALMADPSALRERVPSATDHGRPRGLSSAEVEARRQAGQGNDAQPHQGTTYLEIVRRNLLTFINVTLVGIGLVLISLGQVKDAVLTSVLPVFTATMGVVQEVRAKRRLDRIALLNRIQPTVVRDDVEVKVTPEDLVVGDVVVVRPGDQIPLDGRVVSSAYLEVDESLLTGESDSIAKNAGDALYSGSYCIAGQGYLEVEKVGAASLAARITAGAQARKVTLTPLQVEVNRIVHLLIVVATLLLVLLILQTAVFWHASFQDTVIAAAVVLGIVPPGLFLMISITYAVAAVKLVAQNALVQQTNAIESLSNVDVFCMDKTGTLTTNRLTLADKVLLAGADEGDVERQLGAFAASVPGGTKTSGAIAAAYPAAVAATRQVVAFTSSRKWSGMSSDAAGVHGTFVLGAPDVVCEALSEQPPAAPRAWRSDGLRVLLFARSEDILPLKGDDASPQLPAGLHAVAWLAFKDELRPHLTETLRSFERANVALKIISGDDPETVAAVATQAGFAPDLTAISGRDLEGASDVTLDAVVESTAIFGRVSPQLKERIVGSLRRNGHYVAMTGDGVNDVLSLKKAQLGIALESGSQATRAVADIVLLNDSFDVVPRAFTEGQRIQRGLQGTLYLFLTRVFSVAFIMLLTSLFLLSFPFLPGHITLLTLLTVGIPTSALMVFAPAGRLPERPVRTLVRFIGPSVVFVASAAFVTYVCVYVFHDQNLSQFSALSFVRRFLRTDSDLLARDALTYVLVLCGLWLVAFAAPPTQWFAVIEESTGDWRPTIVAICMLPLYAVIVLIPRLRGFFGINPLEGWLYVLIAVIVPAWMIALRYLWKSSVVDRIIDSSIPARVIHYLTPSPGSPQSPHLVPQVGDAGQDGHR